MLNATDPDSPRDILIYSVIGDTVGELEKLNVPGISISTFTQTEVDQGVVVYYHNGATTGNTKLNLQVIYNTSI
jgi:hypothetical protein